jgi:predicted amidophosphoribosyltransferase
VEALDGVLPITFSVGTEQMHTVLRGYKDNPSARNRALFGRDLAAILWRFLLGHEECLAKGTGVEGFDLVTSVPSRTTARDRSHPLPRLLAGVIEPTASRYRRMLRPTDSDALAHTFDRGRFGVNALVRERRVLLIDDTWTRGSNAQSAAAVLKDAGARAVALVVIGRHVNREFGQNRERLAALRRPFSWEECAVCAGA